MALEPFSLLVLFAITIVVGYIGSLVFEKTHIPDIIWLMLFGLLVSSLNLVDRNVFVVISPFLSAIAILIILFDAGLNMDFYQMVRGVPRGMFLALIGAVVDTLVVTAVGVLVIGMNLLHALLLGIILVGTSSAIVLSVASRLRAREKIKMTLELESIFTDPLVIVVAIVLLNIMVQPGAQLSTVSVAGSSVMSAFSIGAVVGMITGLIWLFALDKLKGKPFDYMLSLAILLLVYVFVEAVGGSGAIGALFFGLVLGNGAAFSRMLKFEKQFTIDHLFKRFQNEVSFFIRSFFFVYLGLIVSIQAQYVLYGIVITFVIAVSRFVVVKLGTAGLQLPASEKRVMSIMIPRGLAPAVLAQLPVVYGIEGADIYTNVIFVVILASVLYTTVAIKFVDGRKHEIAPHVPKKDK
ncbi:MAG: cation:proton antiporter [Candidatus Aenigmarchaeota archaeon]|nr:cation:proton antiporter [Candidatus Aenigmarchaeota archaeon]